MTISKIDFLFRAEVDEQTLDIWLAEHWLVPGSADLEPRFSDADLARACLIRDLQRDLGVNDEGIGIILNLLDQVHGLRSALTNVLGRSPGSASTGGNGRRGKAR
jgi:chaperone modulatory protein CbpM